ncbi:tetratricopeptide repeat protein [Neisseria perflava]|uniref:tetratricopeptide repeat protein n=1 Tax=Neisseria perflava TaxID=33053 RepID=UPI00209FE2D9|nr:tetratricopeptide repeat protein [Neisseria perflava]MCP1659412.1 TPR repeat protein [Neisseria perflava]MCP1772145.1 TPR repeat protein [Neisseria perflava]
MKKMNKLTAMCAALVLCACSAPNQSAQSNEAESVPNTAQSQHANEKAKALLDEGIDAYNRRDYSDAMTLFTQASAAGHMKAPRYIGLMYLNGYGVTKNPMRAVAEFTKGAEQGDITSQYWLAYCYEQGIGVQKDMDQAEKWYQVSARRGDHVAAPAMTALGRLAEVESQEEAVAWYKKAAAVGDKEAQAALARLGVKGA